MTHRRLPQMTPDELETLIRKAVRAEFEAAGLRVDGPAHVDEAREDFRFVRRMRKAFEGASGKVGGFVLLSIMGGIAWLISAGISALWGKS